MSELPTGWAWSTIGELSPYIQRGKSPKYADRSELPVVNQKCIRWTRLETQHLKFIHPEQFDAWDAARRIQPGDILWNSTGTGTVGRAYLVQERDCTPAKVVDSHVTIVRVSAAIEPRYLFSWIRSDAVQNKILEMCDGTTNQIELSRTAIAETAVPIAPAPEQTRIADQLDTLLARIQACQDRLEAIPALLKRFRQAVLGAATNGSLTADWRENREAPAWVPTTIGDLLDGKPRNGYSPKSVDYETSVRSLTLSATTSGRFLSQHTKFIDEPVPADSHLWLEPGDILVQRANTLEYVGVSAIFDGPPKSFIYPDLMMKCRPNKRVNGRFLFFLLSAEPTRRYFRDHATGTAGNMPKINQQTVMSAPVDLPPIEEQLEIVQRANRLLHVLSLLEQRHTIVAAHTRRLAPLTLAKAFRGELVMQDPGDEPANALLARIAAQRDAPTDTTSAPTPRRGRPPRAPKETATMTKSRQDDDVMGKPYLSGHLRRIGTPASAEALFKVAELPVGDFYKQLAWEVAQGHVKDNQTTLEPGHAAG